LFSATGATPGDTVVVYCHIGMRATAVLFAADQIGYPVKLYDGSFQDWSKRTEYPVQ
jgi:thiosulfate/3-mercaptopyruvate sulfurtransferase